MTFFVILLAVAAVSSFEVIRLVIHDGRGPQRPPASHIEDSLFRSPPSSADPGMRSPLG